MAAAESVPITALEYMYPLQELENLEQQIFDARQGVDALWLQMGKLCVEILDRKLYKYRQDENGNYYRTAEAYFRDLEKRMRDKGLPMSYTSLNRFVSDIRLYEQHLGYEDMDLLQLGKSALDAIAPTVRKKLKESKEAAREFVDDLLSAAKANDGLPLSEVQVAVDEATGRVTKGLEVEFKHGLFGQRLSVLKLHWGDDVIDMLHGEVTEEQRDWVLRRMSVPTK